jgi:tetratricopeptide (TPR) repeat protein
MLRESLDQLRELGDRSSYFTGCLFRLGVTLVHAGRFAEARELVDECFQITQNLGKRFSAANIYEELGHIDMLLGNYKQAHDLIEAIQPELREWSDQFQLGVSYCDLGSIALAENRYAEARQLLEKSFSIVREVESDIVVGQTLAYLAYAEQGVGNARRAGQHLSESIRLATKLDADLPLWDALPAAALLMADRGEAERAVELYALASGNPYVGNCQWFEDVAGKHIAAVATTLPPDLVAAAQERGKTLDVWETVAELLALFDEKTLERE